MRSYNFNSSHKQRGAVSLFVVIFTTLIVTTITISFMQLMTKDHQQATYGDLSESAYDSAMAGVEDAKRALLSCQDKATDECKAMRESGTTRECYTLSAVFSGGVTTEAETRIMQSEGDEKLEQAYTCVMVTYATDDFMGKLSPGDNPVLIPLRATDEFNTIVVSWSQNRDGGTIDLPGAGDDKLPVRGDDWPENRPALLRAQLIDGKGEFNLSDFDASGFSNTLFLYPSSVGLSSFDFSLDGRRSSKSGPQLVTCNPGADSGAYICRATLHTDSAIGANSATAFLSLAAFYNTTDFKVELRGPGGSVTFNGAQPEVDSTGRANDLFRRVVSRVELDSTFNYPLSALETSGNLCKNFSVTTAVDDYKNRCDPTRSDL